MEHIRKVEKLSDVQDAVPFIIFTSKGFEILNATFRPEGEKWSTVRFESKVHGKRVRVKEFFLDWFYQGFPKSLMDSFVSTYSPVNSLRFGDSVFFYGKDYRGEHAASAFISGTQIEIEGESRESVIDMSMEIAPLGDEIRFRRLPFHSRSFFARGGRPDWFEERRVASLEWSPMADNLWMGSLRGDSQGILNENGRAVHRISILSEDYMKRVVWVDCLVKERGDSAYRLRKGGNFYNRYVETDGLLAIREPDGPAMFQTVVENNVVTVSFSPLFSLEDMKDIISTILKERKSLFLL
ncbi:MAG: hypothetical protein ACP5UO_01935 [Thermoplasmata archaeon]